MALLAPSRQPIKRQNLHPSTTFDCGLPDRQRARAYAVEAISSVAVCTALCLQIDRYPDTKLCSETMLGLSGTAVVKAIKAERPVSTLLCPSFAAALRQIVTRSSPSAANFIAREADVGSRRVGSLPRSSTSGKLVRLPAEPVAAMRPELPSTQRMDISLLIRPASISMTGFGVASGV